MMGGKSMPTAAETFSMNLSRTASGFGLMIAVLRESNVKGRTNTMKATCNDMTVTEAMDYILAYNLDGITLTEVGRNAAIAILEKRKGWTAKHSDHLKMLREGRNPMPFNLGRTVNSTRLGCAIELARDLSREDRRKQKSKLRRKAAKARRRAAMDSTAA